MSRYDDIDDPAYNDTNVGAGFVADATERAAEREMDMLQGRITNLLAKLSAEREAHAETRLVVDSTQEVLTHYPPFENVRVGHSENLVSQITYLCNMYSDNVRTLGLIVDDRDDLKRRLADATNAAVRYASELMLRADDALRKEYPDAFSPATKIVPLATEPTFGPPERVAAPPQETANGVFTRIRLFLETLAYDSLGAVETRSEARNLLALLPCVVKSAPPVPQPFRDKTDEYDERRCAAKGDDDNAQA